MAEARAQRFISELRDFRAAATSDQLTGQFRLGAMPTTVSEPLPDMLTTWSTRYPQVELRITRATSSALYQGVVAGELDAAIIAEPPFAIPKSCNWQLLRSEPLTLLVPATLRKRDPHAILRSEPFIRNERNTWAGRLVDGYLRHVGIRPQERFELAGIDLIAVLVARGLFWTTVAHWSLSAQDSSGCRSVFEAYGLLVDQGFDQRSAGGYTCHRCN
jgi:DNA-binding transcriptional LysR family regulator